MVWELKTQMLEALYRVYDLEASRFESACQVHCSACCSVNLIGVSLEADYILGGFDHKDPVVQNTLDLYHGFKDKLFRPRLTINELAQACIDRSEPKQDHSQGPVNEKCPFKGPGGCQIYDRRPFACRMMWSQELCLDSGQAVMPDELVSLNGAFQQVMEDMDVRGLYGNIFDLMDLLNQAEIRSDYESGRPMAPDSRTLKNSPNPGFIIPPEHRGYVASALGRLWSERPGGMMFKEAAQHLKEGA